MWRGNSRSDGGASVGVCDCMRSCNGVGPDVEQLVARRWREGAVVAGVGFVLRLPSAGSAGP